MAPPGEDVPTLIELFGLEDALAVAVTELFDADAATTGRPPAVTGDALEQLVALGICHPNPIPSPRPIAEAIDAGWLWREREADRLTARHRAEAAAQHQYLLALAAGDEAQLIGGGSGEINEWFTRIQSDMTSVLDAHPVVTARDVRLSAAINCDKAVFDITRANSERGMRAVNVASFDRLAQFTDRAMFTAEASLRGVELWEGSVALRIAVMDDRTTIIPWDLDDHDLAVVAVDSPRVAAQATALIRAGSTRVLPRNAVEVDDCARRVLVLLARGLTDEAIARRLGVSDRTIRRMVAQLMADIGAESRFQLGYRASRSGLI